MNLVNKIAVIRADLSKIKMNKSGQNKFAKYNYFELSDFLPHINALMGKHGIIDVMQFQEHTVTMTITDGESNLSFSIPYVGIADVPKGMTSIQYVGGLSTYYRRYLYMQAFGITDADLIDTLDPADTPAVKPVDKTQQKTKTNRDIFIDRVNALGLDIKQVASDLKITKDTKDSEFPKLLERLI